MPVHYWNRVGAGIFHDFHNAWITALRNALNDGPLPQGHYALGEQHAGRAIADLKALLVNPPPSQLQPAGRTLAIRHVSGHRLVALVEIVSPANEDRAEHVTELVNKVTTALELGIHVLLVDLFPPGPQDPQGIHGAVWSSFDDEPCEVPTDEPLTLASYTAGPQPDAYVEHLATGGALPDMPLFLRPDRYVNVPLEATYRAAFRGVPGYWREVLEGAAPDGPSPG